MKRYLVADIDVSENKYIFYMLKKDEYIKFLKNNSEILKRDYLHYSYKMNCDAEIYYDFNTLFKKINEKNITILDTYELR